MRIGGLQKLTLLDYPGTTRNNAASEEIAFFIA